jgi:hypothetical protein
MSSVSGEMTGVGGSRMKRDRSKSPGFYSSVSPANGIQAVAGATPSRTNLQKSTVIGLAPIAGTGAPAPTVGANGAAAPHVDGPPASAGAVRADAPIVSPLSDGDAAPPIAIPAAEEEKEDTSPGLGHTPSRHDPALRFALPEKDLNLLLEFVLDLGLGLASHVWLEPVSAAITRLRAAAVKLQRLALDKALAQLGAELEDPNALSDERKSRILQQFLLVDLALPGPMDVAGKRLLRERLIVEQLLGELALSNPLLTQRVRDEGVVSLERLARFEAPQLASKLGVALGDAEQIVSTFQAYLLTRSQRGPELVLLGTARAVEQRLGALEASARDFDRACDTESSEARRRARRQRQNEVAQLNLLLAECGEADILVELERCSVQGKIERLKRWLSELPAN